jgi:hypothetical protein
MSEYEAYLRKHNRRVVNPEMRVRSRGGYRAESVWGRAWRVFAFLLTYTALVVGLTGAVFWFFGLM